MTASLVQFSRSMEGKAAICGGVIPGPECRVLFETVEWSKRKWIDCGSFSVLIRPGAVLDLAEMTRKFFWSTWSLTA